MKTRSMRLMALALVAAALAGRAELPRTADHDYEPPAAGSYTLPVVKLPRTAKWLRHVDNRCACENSFEAASPC